MAFYPFDKTLTLGAVLREGLDDLRGARYKLAHVLGVLNAMSDEQVETQFGFADGAAAKAELQSGIGNLLADDAGVNSASTTAAVLQMLNFFG